jgi:phage gpG-like protein
MAKDFPIKQLEENFKRVIQAAPVYLGNDAVNFFLDSFKLQGWRGESLQPWAKRKFNKGKGAGRSILILSGRLRHGIRIKSNSGGTIVIANDVPYAKFHNDGFKGTINVKAFKRNKYSKHKVDSAITKAGNARMKTVQRIAATGEVKAHTRKVNMPARKFMGQSPQLTKLLQKHLMDELEKGMRSLNFK